MSSKPRTTSAAAESKAPEASEAAPATTTTGATQAQAPAQAAEGQAQGQAQGEGNVNVTGRSVFAIETTAAGVVVRTAFLTEDNRVLDMPAVFPDAFYAFNVIDDLKRQVAQHFSQAAKVGAQVIANQAQAQQAQMGQQATTAAAAQDASSDAEKKSA